jgi:hypothetical protein
MEHIERCDAGDASDGDFASRVGIWSWHVDCESAGYMDGKERDADGEAEAGRGCEWGPCIQTQVRFSKWCGLNIDLVISSHLRAPNVRFMHVLQIRYRFIFMILVVSPERL